MVVRSGSRRWRTALIGLGLVVLVTTGCSPDNQGGVFRDPSSGQPVLVVGLCDGEQIDAVTLTIPDAPEGHGVLWRVERGATAPSVDRVVLGAVPSGFDETVALDRAAAAIRPVELTAELHGGAAEEASDTFEVSTLDEATPEEVSSLRSAAQRNCAALPMSLPRALDLLAPLALLAALLGAMSLRSEDGPQPRVGRRSVWRWSFGFAVLGAYLLLIPSEGGTRNEPLRYLGLGSVLGLVVIACAAAGRRLRRSDPPRTGWEGLLVAGVACLVVVPATLLLGSFEGGGFIDCGTGWTFDCTPTWWDRLILLAPLTAAWVTAIRIGEGGWWLSGSQDPAGAPDDTPRPPVKRGIALGALLVVGLVATLVQSNQDEKRQISLVEAAGLCEATLVRDLIAQGADPNRAGTLPHASETTTPINVASRYCGRDVIDALVDAGATVNPHEDPPLLTAAHHENAAALDALVEAGADPNPATEGGSTVLAAAARSGDDQLVRHILAAGASADVPNGSNQPLFEAVSRGHADAADALLTAGADPNARGKLNWVEFGAYIYALDEHEQDAVVQKLGPALGLDADLLARVSPGDGSRTVETFEALPNLYQTVVGSFPPLYVAAARGDVDVVRVLLASGADPTIGTDPTGHLPAQAAEALGHEDVLALLAPLQP